MESLAPAHVAVSVDGPAQEPKRSSASSSSHEQQEPKRSSSASSHEQQEPKRSAASSADHQEPKRSSSASMDKQQVPKRSSSSSSQEKQEPKRASSSSPAALLPPMARGLSKVAMVPVEDPCAHRTRVVYASNEFVRVVPYAFSYVRWALYGLLFVGSGGLLLIVSVWFPQVFTHLTRIRLPGSCLGDAQFMLVLVQQDDFGSTWVEVPVHRNPEPTPPPRWWTSLLTRLLTRLSLRKAEPAKADDTSEKKKTTQQRPWIWFEFKKHRYVFNHDKGEFERYLAKVKEPLSRMRDRLDSGLDAATVDDKRELFGRNVVDIDPPFVPMLLFTKVVHPYYLFQVFSAAVWFAQGYTIYAATILVLSAGSMAWEIYSEIANCNSLRDLVRSDHHVQAVRASETKKTPEAELVPGDIVEVAAGPVVADMLLLSGSCVTDEASLTGEAIPINKEPAQNGSEEITDAEAQVLHKTSFLHAGSTVTRVRNTDKPCRAVVMSTGFSTGKGELFRSILFPRAIAFEFERDSYRYLAVLATIAIAAFIKRLVNFADQGYGVGYSIVNSLDLITIAVPPALPLVLSSGIGFALKRLAKAGIFCIDAQRINSCGQLDTYCFDKTGTLTQESMTLVGFDGVSEAGEFETCALDRLDSRVRLAMATCHSLSDADGHTQGSPLELAMFEAARLACTSVKDEATKTDTKVVTADDGTAFRVVKRFPFDAACQRSSVVVENVTTGERLVFVKGSPEAVTQIATRTPEGAAQRTLKYSAEGNYCIAFAVRELSKDVPLDVDKRLAVEASVDVMGIALFHNELKPESEAMLRELYDADIDVRMITGDNALTAVHVAKELKMPLKTKSEEDKAKEPPSSDEKQYLIALVDVNDSCDVVYHCLNELHTTDPEQWEHLTNANVARLLLQYDVALTGAAIEQLKLDLSDDSMKQLLLQTKIFARIRPTQKSWIIERLMDYGKIVGMCGDGTNDCGALKAAHVGLALSSAEASIVAPFTSKAKAVTDVPVLIREGRCALTTSFLGFKFMVLYPIIQLGMASTLGHFGTMLSNNQYIWDDLAIVLGLAITMLYTGASRRLSKERPPHTLFSRAIVASIVGQVVLFVGLFAAMFAILNAQPWFCRRADGMRLADFAKRAPTMVASLPVDVQINCAFNLAYLDDVKELVDDIPVSHEGASVWLFGHMQYLCVALAFNIKDRFRQPFYTNVSFTALFLACLGVNLWFLLDTSGTIDATFQTVPLSSSYRLMMLGMFLAHFVLAVVWEGVATGAFKQWKEEFDARKTAKQTTKTPLALPAVKGTEEVHVAIAVDADAVSTPVSDEEAADEASPVEKKAASQKQDEEEEKKEEEAVSSVEVAVAGETTPDAVVEILE